MSGNELYHISKRLTVAHFIPCLDFGGAERQLIELAKGINKARWDVLILTDYINPSLYDEIISTEKIRIIRINKTSKILYPFRLLATVYREKPLLINAYLLSAQIYTLLVRPFLPRMKVIFSVRDASDYSEFHGSKGRWFRFLMKKSVSLVDCYIFNSTAGRRERNGIPDSKVSVIPNGIDTVRFYPDPLWRTFVRKEANIDGDELIVGIVGNFSIYKGYDTFIRAARTVIAQLPNVRFITVGNHDTPLGKAMRELIIELELKESFYFLGSRSDIHLLLPGFDIFCSSSITEGFSNAICEGMACGVPCVVTDVGDSAVIVGDTGIVVPPRDPEMLAAGILKLLLLSQAERRQLGGMARSRIEENFGIPRMVAATEKVYEKILHHIDKL